MSNPTKREYMAIMRERYHRAATRREKSEIIHEIHLATQMHVKSVIRTLNDGVASDQALQPQLGRPRRYLDEVVGWLKYFYRESEYVCSTKLKAMLPLLIAQSEKEVKEPVRAALTAMSRSSIDRYLGEYRKLERRRKNTGTRPGSRLFRRMIPLKNLNNTATGCGVLEADTVAHCGGNLSGTFIWSLTTTDEYSGWTVNRAIYGKRGDVVLQSLKTALTQFPFELRLINVDNGTEFLNHLVYGYFLSFARENGVEFPMTRSRSYQKNDNARAEQKNWMMVRQLFGYERFDSVILTETMNQIYEIHGLIQNYFVPQLKLKSKVRIQAKIKKTYYPALTPLERVLGDPQVSEEKKIEIRRQFENLNYYKLKHRKEELLAYFLKIQKLLKSKQGPEAA